MIKSSQATDNIEQPLCSVCVANYNGLETIKRCLDSIANQTCSFSIEIIVHDDASTDDSVNYIKHNYPQAVLIENHKNVGFCTSNNRMADIARGQYILLLNNDAELFPDALSSLHKYAGKQAKQGILGLPQYNMQTGELIDIGSFLDPFLNPQPNLNKENREVAHVIGACLWIPKELWLTLGGFPEWFQSVAEDLYLCCYARLTDYPVAVLAHSGFKHWVGKSLGGGKVSANKLSTTINRRSLSERNKTFVMILFYPVVPLIIIFPLHILFLILEGIVITLIKRNTTLWKNIYWNCLKETWNNKTFLIKKRKKIQSLKKVSNKRFFSVHKFIPYKIILLIKYGIPKINS